MFHICLVSNFAHVIIGICMRYRNKYMCALEKWTKSPNLSVHIWFSVSCVCVYLVCFGYYETDIAMTCGIFFLGKLMLYIFCRDWVVFWLICKRWWKRLRMIWSWGFHVKQIHRLVQVHTFFSLRLYTTNWWKKKIVFAASQFLSKINQCLSFTVPICAANK